MQVITIYNEIYKIQVYSKEFKHLTRDWTLEHFLQKVGKTCRLPILLKHINSEPISYIYTWNVFDKSLGKDGKVTTSSLILSAISK